MSAAPGVVVSVTFYVFDERGNVVERLDSSGAVLTRHAYTAYGRDYTNTNPSNLNLVDEPWGFGAQYGYYTDRETNYIYCTFRYYDPQLGRWLNRDPAGYGGGLNLYKYCSNNPINHIDPLGLSPNDPYDFTEGDIPTSNAQIYARAGSDFANDKMWKGGSCQRKEFSQGISMIPVVGNVNQAVIAATGYDYIAGDEVTGLQRGLAIAGTALTGSEALGKATTGLAKLVDLGEEIDDIPWYKWTSPDGREFDLLLTVEVAGDAAYIKKGHIMPAHGWDDAIGSLGRSGLNQLGEDIAKFFGVNTLHLPELPRTAGRLKRFGPFIYTVGKGLSKP